MSSQQMESLKILCAFWETRPPKRPADARLENKFDRIAAKIKRPIEPLGFQQHLGVSKTRPSNCSQVSC